MFESSPKAIESSPKARKDKHVKTPENFLAALSQYLKLSIEYLDHPSAQNITKNE